MSVGWSLSVGKIQEKLWMNQQPALKWYVKCAIQGENQQNQHCPSASFMFYAKKKLSRLEDKVEWKQNYLPLTGTDHCNSKLSENIQF